MFKDLKTRVVMWVVGVLAVAVLMPASAAAEEYGSEQQSVDSYSVNCGHLGTSCEETGKANSRPRKARKACARKARSKRRSSGVRAYAALPNGNKHSSRRKARCARQRR